MSLATATNTTGRDAGAHAASGGGGGRTALVLGGGVAGIAAAVRLAESGWRVTLVERRKMLGGRAGSHVDPRTGGLLDNCQHVVLRCCTNLIDLYRRLGVEHLVRWHDTMYFLDRRGNCDVLRRGRLPAPLHLSESVLRFGCLGWPAKLAIGRAMMALVRADEREARWGVVTFAEWLAEQRQPAEAVRRFWNVVVTSALNGTVHEVSASAAMQLFRQAFLGNGDAYVMGVASVPMAALYEPVTELLEGCGGRVMLGTSVRRLVISEDRVIGAELDDGELLRGDVCIAALPPDQLLRVAPEGVTERDARFRGLGGLRFNPIVGVHLWFDEPVTELPHGALVDSPVHWFFNHGMDGTGRQHLQVVISAARDWVHQSPEAITGRVVHELSAYLPDMRHARAADARVIKERRATFVPAPRVEALRPAGSGDNGLLLAGDYCATGWPATMEGAARSGYLAAGAATGTSLMAEDLPAAWVMRGRGGSGARSTGCEQPVAPDRRSGLVQSTA